MNIKSTWMVSYGKTVPYIASGPDLDPECRRATEQEAVENLQEALALFFEDLPGPVDGCMRG